MRPNRPRINPVSNGSYPTETAPTEENLKKPVYLLGDGQTAPGWYSSGTIQPRADDRGSIELGGDDYETGMDANISYNGGQSGFIRGLAEETNQAGSLIQTVLADSYRGQRVHFSVYLKTEDVEQVAGAGVAVLDAYYRPINVYHWRHTNLQGTNDWQRSDIVLDVPQEAVYLSIQATLRGKGAVWVDDWAIEIVDETVPITLAYDFVNPSFEKFDNNKPVGWFLSGIRSQDVVVGLDSQYVRHGQSSVIIQAEATDATQGGTLMQTFSARPYWGQRLRLTGFVRAESVEDGAMMWLRVDGPAGSWLLDNTAFHNHGPIRGSTDWELLTIVLDVPEGSSDINLGFILSGNGRIWVDDLLLEMVDDEVRTTVSTNSPSKGNWALTPFLKNPQFTKRDLGDPLNDWFISGDRVEAYEVGVDTAVGHSNGQSGYVKHIGGHGLGTLAQVLLTEQYRGERVQVRVYIRAENTDQQASFWLRINGEHPLDLATVPLADTADWQLQELTLDIPEESVYFSFGITNAGQGTVWIDDVEFDVVDESVPTTSSLDTADFVNLGFERITE